MGKFFDTWTKWLGGDSDKHEAGGEEAGLPALLRNRTSRNLLILAALGALLILVGKTTSLEQERPASGGLEEQPTAVAPIAQGQPKVILETELKRILSKIAGVGEVDVYITLDTGPEKVLAEEVTSERTTEGGDAQAVDVRETRRPVTVRDDTARTEKPIVLVEKEPRVRGVLVVADGAHSGTIRYQISEAVQTALGIAANRVAVFSRAR